MDQAQDSLVSSDGKPLRSDWLFLLFLVACLTGAVYVGVLAYREGAKTEASKHAGEAWLQWFIENGPLRQQDGYAPESCAAQQGSTWGGCQNWDQMALFTNSAMPTRANRCAWLPVAVGAIGRWSACWRLRR
jgi:hypothetical protein